MATVQFDHRARSRGLLALLSPVVLVEAARTRRRCRRARASAATAAARCVALQIALGIATLLLVVPVPLAAAHQAGAVLFFAAALNVANALR